VHEQADAYPYGVGVSAELLDYPASNPTGWGAAATPPHQQMLRYTQQAAAVFVCPSDASPGEFSWWEYGNHPGIAAASYMFSEHAAYAVTWFQRRVLRAAQVRRPDSFAYAADGDVCLNGWTWRTVDPSDPSIPNPPMQGDVRIRWSHLGRVSVLFGDMSVRPAPQRDAAYTLRTDPRT
jgi:hypothetical protein